jgi:hypothetical protein
VHRRLPRSCERSESAGHRAGHSGRGPLALGPPAGHANGELVVESDLVAGQPRVQERVLGFTVGHVQGLGELQRQVGATPVKFLGGQVLVERLRRLACARSSLMPIAIAERDGQAVLDL